jgi:hypothetical protein
MTKRVIKALSQARCRIGVRHDTGGWEVLTAESVIRYFIYPFQSAQIRGVNQGSIFTLSIQDQPGAF